MKSSKGSSIGAKSGVKSKSSVKSGSGLPSITESHTPLTESHATLKDRAAENMAAFKKSRKH